MSKQSSEAYMSTDPDRLEVKVYEAQGASAADGARVIGFQIHRKNEPDFVWMVTPEVARKIKQSIESFFEQEKKRLEELDS